MACLSEHPTSRRATLLTFVAGPGQPGRARIAPFGGSAPCDVDPANDVSVVAVPTIQKGSSSLGGDCI
jgi:hypothetical protein